MKVDLLCGISFRSIQGPASTVVNNLEVSMKLRIKMMGYFAAPRRMLYSMVCKQIEHEIEPEEYLWWIR